MTPTQEIYDAIQRSNASIQAIAEGLGKAESTLYAELNGTRGAKLGLQDALNIMRMIGDYRPLHSWGGYFGFSLVKMGSSQDSCGDIVNEAMDIQVALGPFVAAVRECVADGKITEVERKVLLESCMTLLREVGDALAAIGGPAQ